MINVITKMFSVLTSRDKFYFFLLVIMMFAGAVLELAGLGLVMPVIAMLTNPELMVQNKYLKIIYSVVSPSSNEQFILLLCVAIILLYVCKNIFLMVLTALQAKFVYSKIAEFSSILFNNYINAPYGYFFKKNTSEILNNINMAGNLAHGIILPGMMLIAESILIFSILMVLLFFTPYLTVCLAIASAFIMFLLYYPLKHYNSTLGERCNRHNGEVFRDIMQSFEGIKETKLHNCEDVFSEYHSGHQKTLRNVQMIQYFMGQLPRFSIEVFVVVAGMGVLSIFILSGIAKGSMILKFSIMALAMVRLMPSFSRIQYYQFTIRHNLSSFNIVFHDMIGLRPGRHSSKDLKPIVLHESIRINSVSFAYEESGKFIENFNLEIPLYSSVALIGATGCGKTTLLDIILGLLKPSCGSVLVDGRNIEENLSSWQKQIGYVPQSIFLADNTIRRNVAFGVLEKDIDDAQVRKCLEAAQLLHFVDELPDGLNSMIGEHGVRLSGGQRQRIGIARALYNNPEVLALDEATSALDSDTEKAFIDAINMLKGKLTIIMIAHRMTTIEKCDIVVKINSGKMAEYIKREDSEFAGQN